AGTAEEAVKAAGVAGLPAAVKAQVLVGGRGKAGGVKVAKTGEKVKEFARQILNLKIKNLPVKKVLIEQALAIEQEYYLGITVDRANKCNTLMFSEVGGVDIEEVAREQPDKIVKIRNPKSEIRNNPQISITQILNETVQKLTEAYFAVDATLIEINPLVKTRDGKFIAADAKIIADDNALFRHPELSVLQEETEEDEIEAEARRRKIAYVRLPGNIGIIGNGAGLVMSTMDEVQRAGGKPASFLDIGGGAKAELVKNCFEILTLDKNIKGIFFNVFGGITRCDEVAKGINEALKALKIDLPIVIRLTGTNESEGRALLSGISPPEAGQVLIVVETMQEGARKIVEYTR
ncbi:ADP-forming succinate--CoA ligase subunit beta, partial [Candidatus Saganbacteria bacterium]|nr:ADP-forming succinate--CoA ligase subunit beta [Candidatus Saganbacteria bacterium]